MPVLLIKVEGRGNGIKTVLPNIEDVARSLNRPATYATKFFGCELGAQTSFATPNDDRYIVNGAHTADRLRELLDVFIDKFVLCASCKNPETELVFTGKGKNEDIHRDCKACGKQTGLDMRHKVVTFILKNKPEKKKKGGKGMTAEANVGGPMVFDADADGGDDADPGLNQAVPTRGTDIDAALGRESDPVLADPDAAEEVSNKLHSLGLNGGPQSPGPNGHANGDDDDEDEDADSPYTQLGEWVAANREAENGEITAKIQELGVAGKYKVLVPLLANMFSGDADKVADELKPRVILLQALATGEKHQKALLGGYERFVGASDAFDELATEKVTSKVLMELYQNDVVAEEVIQHWATHVTGKYTDKKKSKKIRKTADPFVKWLEEADEDESDEE